MSTTTTDLGINAQALIDAINAGVASIVTELTAVANAQAAQTAALQQVAAALSATATDGTNTSSVSITKVLADIAAMNEYWNLSGATYGEKSLHNRISTVEGNIALRGLNAINIAKFDALKDITGIVGGAELNITRTPDAP